MDLQTVHQQINPSRIIDDRIGLIKEFCKNKVVLDVGCVEHLAEEESSDQWLHKIIKGVAKSVTGVDFEKEEVEKLRAKGYDVVFGDAETVSLGRTFDVAVAGELIEHLSNPGLFLANMHRHLNDGGILIITTPNAFAFRYVIAHIFAGGGASNAQHTCYFDYYTLKELCGRYPFEIVESDYFFDDKPGIKHFVTRLFTSMRKSYAPRILFVLKKKPQ